jgi:holo-[acyl-carrier protein] synthase
VRIDSLREAIDCMDSRVASRLFTASELDFARRGDKIRWESLAGRLAAKVAARRLLAGHGHKAGWREIEVMRGDRGQPLLVLHGRARRVAEESGLQTPQVSISHEAGIAVAVVLAWMQP